MPLEMMRAVFKSQFSVIDKLAVTIALLPSFLVRYLAGRKS